MIVLSNNIGDSSIEYRAIFGAKRGGDVFVIQQKVELMANGLAAPGQWFVSTLMEDPVRDKLHRLRSKVVVSGIREALANVPEDYNRFVSTLGIRKIWQAARSNCLHNDTQFAIIDASSTGREFL